MSYWGSWSLDTAIWPWGTNLLSPWLGPVYQMESSRRGTSRTHPVVSSLTVLSVQTLSPLASSRLPASQQVPASPNSSSFPKMGRQGHRSAMAVAAKRDSGSASDGLTVACIPPGPPAMDFLSPSAANSKRVSVTGEKHISHHHILFIKAAHEPSLPGQT